MARVTIIDYGNGNANSIRWALGQLGATSIYSHLAQDIDGADHLILPGVGHHGAAMESLRKRGLLTPLARAVLERRIPTLGICLGMQLMTRSSEEGGQQSLSYVNAETVRIRPADRRNFKVPHVGWNTISNSPSLLLRGVNVGSQPFYFCHAYAIRDVTGADNIATVQYDRDYIALFEAGNVFGVQFHPEKSQEPGLKLLENFLRLGT
ncbi:MAG: imidazole glycerol phosphate synthase subunit HisH [Myxococcaceae bacterium]|nr:imidazole glycerol phosphate synthase subunit HisH [Myxococcaceae bacterium]